MKISLKCEGSHIEYKKISQVKWVSRLGGFIQVNRKRYRLIYCEDLVLNGNEVAGLCVSALGMILIGVDFGDVTATLIHEAMHGEFCESGFRQRPDWTRELEEHVVETVSQAIAHNFNLKKRI